MQAILFQLKKLTADQSAEQNKWSAAAYDIERLEPTKGSISHGLQGCLLILDGNDSPVLAKAIDFAANRQLAYSITFFEKATVWDYNPPNVV